MDRQTRREARDSERRGIGSFFIVANALRMHAGSRQKKPMLPDAKQERRVPTLLGTPWLTGTH